MPGPKLREITQLTLCEVTQPMAQSYDFLRTAHLSIAADEDRLAGQHGVRAPLERVDDRLPLAVVVVQARLGDGVVRVHGRARQLLALVRDLAPLVQPEIEVNTHHATIRTLMSK